MDLLEVIEEFLLNFLMLFNPFPSWFLYESDIIAHSSLNSGSVEEFSVSFSLFQPSDSGLLLPVYLLLLSSLLQLIVDVMLLLKGSFCVASCAYFLLQFRQGFLKIMLRLEDVSEGLAIPSLKVEF